MARVMHHPHYLSLYRGLTYRHSLHPQPGNPPAEQIHVDLFGQI